MQKNGIAKLFENVENSTTQPYYGICMHLYIYLINGNRVSLIMLNAEVHYYWICENASFHLIRKKQNLVPIFIHFGLISLPCPSHVWLYFQLEMCYEYMSWFNRLTVYSTISQCIRIQICSSFRMSVNVLDHGFWHFLVFVLLIFQYLWWNVEKYVGEKCIYILYMFSYINTLYVIQFPFPYIIIHTTDTNHKNGIEISTKRWQAITMSHFMYLTSNKHFHFSEMLQLCGALGAIWTKNMLSHEWKCRWLIM